MICRRRNIIFVHVPKTGGTSIEAMVFDKPHRVEDLMGGLVRPGYNKYQSGGLQHLTARLIRQEVGAALFDACYRFALVRDPVDRLVSQYNYLRQRGDLVEWLDLDAGRTFSRYLDRIASVEEHVQWKPQVDFLIDDNGDWMVELFRLEDLSQDIVPLAARLGENWTSMARSEPEGYQAPADRVPRISRDNLDSEEIARIAELYRVDYEMLGYPVPASSARGASR